MICIFFYSKYQSQWILPYTEKITHRLISKFKSKIKDIDPILLDVHDQCEKIYKKSEQYVPGIYNYQIKNTSEVVTKYHQEYFGDPVKENLYLYYDRKEKMGLKYFDKDELTQSIRNLSALSKAIIERQ